MLGEVMLVQFRGFVQTRVLMEKHEAQSVLKFLCLAINSDVQNDLHAPEYICFVR